RPPGLPVARPAQSAAHSASMRSRTPRGYQRRVRDPKAVPCRGGRRTRRRARRATRAAWRRREMHPHPSSSARLPADRGEPIDPRMPTMRHLPPLSCLLAAALAGAHASAQSLIGGAHSPATGPILARQDLCTASERLCAPLLAPPPAPFAGGTAYDPTRQAVWNTDGVSLVGLSA